MSLSGQELRRCHSVKHPVISLNEGHSSKKGMTRWIFECTLLILLLFALCQITGVPGGAVHYEQTPDEGHVSDPESQKTWFEKKNIRDMLDSKCFMNLKSKGFDFVSDDHRFHVETSINIRLQNFILEKIDRSTSRHIGIVAMDPYAGRVLAMVGFDEDDPNNNPCTDSRFPAASIFKIVTAAAAIEKCGLNSDSQVTYSGRKHTLYKSQMKKRKKGVRKVTLRDSFAQSINPVFGKIGTHDLGKTTLEEYADAFGFNREISFEIPLTPSVIDVSDRPYHWAEIASGFNRETRISPLHGALIASAIINQGRLIEPMIIDEIRNEQGQMVYQSHYTPLNQAITPDASKVMSDLMQGTIESGTCKKVFRGYQKDPVLSRLSIGGKTGSINSKKRDARYDWFVGFAEEKEGAEKMVISVVVAHGKYIGIRAAKYARIFIKEYFSNYYSISKQRSESENQG